MTDQTTQDLNNASDAPRVVKYMSDISELISQLRFSYDEISGSASRIAMNNTTPIKDDISPETPPQDICEYLESYVNRLTRLSDDYRQLSIKLNKLV